MNTVEHMPYEGGGFLLHHKRNILLGKRVKSDADKTKDATEEVEYMGGKPEASDKNDPLQTAFAELVEELGQNILDADWRNRVVPIHIYQPFSKKWIWCNLFELNDVEYQRLCGAALELQHWPIDEKRSLESITGRPAPARKALSSVVAVSSGEFARYMEAFTCYETKTDNRMNDAKKFRMHNTLECHSILDNSVVKHPLRGFNTVIFEEHAKTILAAVNK